MLSAQKCHYHLVIKLHYSLDFESIPFLTLILGRDTDQLVTWGREFPETPVSRVTPDLRIDYIRRREESLGVTLK